MRRRGGWMVLLVALAGCSGEKRTPTYAVTGRVLVNGKPAERAQVVFHPIGGAPDAPKPHGEVAADGSFQLTTYDGNDGAPAGKYKVAVVWYLSSGRGDEMPTSRLPDKFGKPESSGLEAEVTTGPTTLKAFELKK